MELFEYLRSSGQYCCLEIKSDYRYYWDVYLTLSELVGNKNHQISAHASSEQLPYAICLAALRGEKTLAELRKRGKAKCAAKPAKGA